MIKWRNIELPGFDRPLRAVGKKRRGIFAAFLEQLIGEVSRPRTRTADKMKTRPEAMTFADACRACRGHCCRKGGDHGYISPSTLQRVLAADPALGGDALIATYVSHVPARSYAGSCIYHSASGCALPRTLRSEVCTSYLCAGLKTLSEGASQHPERAVVGVF